MTPCTRATDPHRHDISDSLWEKIEPHIPGRKGNRGRTAKDSRRFFNAVLWIARSGAPWRDLPRSYGNWNSIFKRFRRYCKTGVWENLVNVSIAGMNLRWIIIDASHIKVHQHGMGAVGGSEDVGRTKGGMNTKIHVAVDKKGRPVKVLITAGNIADCTQAIALLGSLLEEPQPESQEAPWEELEESLLHLDDLLEASLGVSLDELLKARQDMPLEEPLEVTLAPQEASPEEPLSPEVTLEEHLQACQDMPLEEPREGSGEPVRQSVMADKAYDTDSILEYIYERRATPVIPPRSNRKEQRDYDKELYKFRRLVENYFQKLKAWRGLATRYAKTSLSFGSFINIFNALLWAKAA